MYEVDLFVQSVMNALFLAGDLSLAFLASLPLLAVAWAHVPMASNKAIRVSSSPLPVVEEGAHRSACLAYMAEQRAETELERRIERTIARLSSTRGHVEQEWVEAGEEGEWNGLVIVTEECVLLTYSELVELPDGMTEGDVLELVSLVQQGLVILPAPTLEVYGPHYWWDDQDRYAVEEDGTIFYIE